MQPLPPGTTLPYKSLFKNNLSIVTPFLSRHGLIFSCNKSDELTVDEAVDQALYSAQERGGLGRYGCYELVFSVTIALPDGTIAKPPTNSCASGHTTTPTARSVRSSHSP